MAERPNGADPVLHLLAGPDGSGMSTFVEQILKPTTHLPFVNAHVIAGHKWPHDQAAHAYEASRLAAVERDDLIAERSSFITETVFSHLSKVDLARSAHDVGYLVHLHVMVMPVDLCVARVSARVVAGGHSVPESKIRQRHERLWANIVLARAIVDQTTFYDNTRANSPFRVIARYRSGDLVGSASWPTWAPAVLTEGF